MKESIARAYHNTMMKISFCLWSITGNRKYDLKALYHISRERPITKKY